MFKVLIVDDDHEKIRKISSRLCRIHGVNLESISHESDANAAKLRLKSSHYDCLLIDMAIPTRIDKIAKRDGGLELLKELFDRDLYRMPSNIICVTAFPDIYTEAKEYTDQNLVSFVYCDPTTDAWLEQIAAAVWRGVVSREQERITPSEYESFLAVVCALETPELKHILNNGWSWEKMTIVNDASIYYRANVSIGGTTRLCYASAAPRKGMPAAAILATKMISCFRPEYLTMAGITSGYRTRTKLGDIIAADPVWDWGSGKLVQHRKKTEFEPEPHQLDLDVGVRNKLRLLAQDTTVLSSIKESWDGVCPSHMLSMHLGPLASGATVLADEKTVSGILSHHRGLLGIDMETYAIFAAAQEAIMPRPKVFTMKSVVDFGDGQKDDTCQEYGAFTSSQALRIFVEKHL